ncbi:uncharacterized protein LOC111463790 [Cucurbita moschata]|uniref:Uncharacterized protein LOC111463790 n=1 Tax=Cucurbita moschata TaxID=3662 RepID=A0A6J1HHW4_CUCMO|nr:uncharacterized protein LOC111463790 [Cucurbita moschata]
MRKLRRVFKPLLGRSRSSSFRRLVQNALEHLETLKKLRHGRYVEDRKDAARLLHEGLPKLALSRCEQMFRHQNLMDAYGMMEGYLNLLRERLYLLAPGRECPKELEEAVSSVVFAASRCEDFPELEEIKSVLSSRFGTEFAARAVELRNNNTVNHSIMLKLSTRKPNLESKMNLLRVIASENGFTLQLNDKGEPISCTATRQRKRGASSTKRTYRTRSSSRK